MDFLTHLPCTARGHTAVLIVVDRLLSKMAHFILTRDEADAVTTAEIFMREIFRLHGAPETIISDRDPRFTSVFWDTLMKLLGTKLKMSSACHPQTDGQSKCTIHTLQQYLRSYINQKQTNWDLHLPLAEFAYNSSTQSSTGFAPFHVVYGSLPRLPVTLVASKPPVSNTPAVQTFAASMHDDLQVARKEVPKVPKSPTVPAPALPAITRPIPQVKAALKCAQEVQASYANQKRKAAPFKEGDLVLLRIKDLDLETFTLRTNRALSPKYIGPYKILQVISPNTYRLEFPSHISLHPVVNASHLCLYHTSPNFPNCLVPPTHTQFILESKSWEVYSIMSARFNKGGHKFLVHWAGRPLSDMMWVPARYLENAHKLIVEYDRRQALGSKASEGRGAV